MARTKRKKTLADYVVIAISPVLIMTLVGSLAFFLLELSYHGQYELRLKWILFWFVLAAVLVARIAIEQGKEHASLFGIALIVVVGLAAIRLVDEFLVAWVLCAVCWWCTWKLTWDCTLIDDNEDASGEGLLQAAGFDGGAGTPAKSLPPAAPAALTAGVNAPEATDGDLEVDRLAGNRRVHAPGKWVVYFSLAALPLFGAGQLLIPSYDTAARAYAFGLLALYVASALGLLLTTSFLGLRRYLRQRKLQMPPAVTAAWLGMGTALAIAILCLALFLPQPQGEYSLNALVDKIDTKLHDASQRAVIPGDRAKGKGRRIGEQDRKADKAGKAQPQNEKSAKQDGQAQKQKADPQQNQGNQEQKGDDQKGDAKSGGDGEKKSDAKGQAQQQAQNNDARKEPGENKQNDKADRRQAAAKAKAAERQGNRSSPPPASSSGSAITSLLQSLASPFKWLVYGTLALIVLFLAIRHWSRLGEILAQLWAELLSLFGIRPKEERATSDETAAPPVVEVPFSAYENPFFSGAARRMSPAQLVQYTFEALEAWGREQIVARRPEQTPLEFAEELGRRDPALAKDAAAAAELYTRVAYARKSPSRESVEFLERLWRRMGMGAGVG